MLVVPPPSLPLVPVSPPNAPTTNPGSSGNAGVLSPGPTSVAAPPSSHLPFFYRGAKIRRSSIDPLEIQIRIAAINILQTQQEIALAAAAAAAQGNSDSKRKQQQQTVNNRSESVSSSPRCNLPLAALSSNSKELGSSPTGATSPTAVTSTSEPSRHSHPPKQTASASYTGRIVPEVGGEVALPMRCHKLSLGPMCMPTPGGAASAPGSGEAHMLQLHVMRHYPLTDQHYFSQQECYLNKTVTKWEFDVLKLEKSSAQGVLKDVCLRLMEVQGLVDEFNLSLVQLHQTLHAIQASYHLNPYHNAAHAADVVQAAYCLTDEEKLSRHLTSLERLAMMFAAACHDLDHPGVNQSFLTTTNHYLTEAARKYPSPRQPPLSTTPRDNPDPDPGATNGTTAAKSPSPSASVSAAVSSVLEIHHIRHAVAIFEQTGVFAHFPPDQLLALFRLIRELILATDMAYQTKYMEKLKRLNSQYAELSEEGKDAFFQNADNRRFYLQIALKCADICNTCRPWEVSQKWSRRVTEEFFAQGDRERNLCLPINEINDRFKTSIEKIQVGFLRFVAKPLFLEWHRMQQSRTSSGLLSNIEGNLQHWDQIREEIIGQC